MLGYTRDSFALRAGCSLAVVGILGFSCAYRARAGEKDYVIKPSEDAIVWSVAFAADGKSFAATQEGKILLYATADGQPLGTVDSQSNKEKRGDGCDNWIVGLDFSPNGELLAGCRADGTVSLWSTAGYRELARLDIGPEWNTCVCFSPDGTQLAVGGRGNCVSVWNVKEQELATTLMGHMNWVDCVTFSPDGSSIASGSEDGTVRLWDVRSGAEVQAYGSSTDAVKGVRFSPNGDILLSAWKKELPAMGGLIPRSRWKEFSVRLWDVESGESPGVLEGHTSTVQCIHVLSDNRTVLTASRDGTVRAWDLDSKIQVNYIREQGISVESMDVSRDEGTIVCGCQDSSIEVRRIGGLLSK
jgi:WD40 repeat protein